MRRVIRDQVPEVTPHFATPEFDAALRQRIAAYLAVHRANLRPDNLELAMKIAFITVEAACEQLADEESEVVLAELEVLLGRYLLAGDDGEVH